MIAEFITELYRYCPEDARVVFCQFSGDPSENAPGNWRVRVLRPDGLNVMEEANVYFCISAMYKNGRGEWRRKVENFAGGLCIMIDDIGTGLGAKHPMSAIDPLTPTCLIETSPQNYQAIYMFDKLITDRERLDGLINAMIEQGLTADADPGMRGINRVFRPPVGINGKEKYRASTGVWRVGNAAWNPHLRYSITEICDAFGITIRKRVKRPRRTGVVEGTVAERIDMFEYIYNGLKFAGMLKREQPNMGGWIEITCPWIDEHGAVNTKMRGADSGAAIRIPDVENEWFGAFHCNHSHGQADLNSNSGRNMLTWRHLVSHLEPQLWEMEVAALEKINKEADRGRFFR